MVSNGYIPKFNMPLDISTTKLNSFVDAAGPPMRMQSLEQTAEAPKFKDVMTGMVKELDATVKAPDQVLQNALVGQGADVHDVMIAMSKAELGVNIASQITTKVIQSYEKIIAIQV